MSKSLLNISLLVFLVCLFCIAASKRPVESSFNFLKTTNSFPLITPNGDLLSEESSYIIGLKDSLMIYQIPLNHVETREENSDSDTVNIKVDSDKVTKSSYYYFVIKDNDEFGLLYFIDEPDEKPQKKSREWFLKMHNLDTANFKIHSVDAGPVSSVVKDKKTGKIILEKIFTKKHKSTDPDSVYRYYNAELKDIPFSFSPKFDKEKDSKLVRTSWIYNPIPKSRGLYPKDVPRVEIFWEIKKVQLTNTENFEKIMAAYKKDSALLSK